MNEPDLELGAFIAQLPPDLQGVASPLYRRLVYIAASLLPALGEGKDLPTLEADLQAALTESQEKLSELQLAGEEYDPPISHTISAASKAGARDLMHIRTSAQDAILAARRAVRARARAEPMSGLKARAALGLDTGGAYRSRVSKSEGGDQVAQASTDVTTALERAVTLLSEELGKSSFSAELLQESSDAMAQLAGSYTSFEGLLQTSQVMVKKLKRQDVQDRIAVLASLAFFIFCVLYIFKQRLVDPTFGGVAGLAGGTYRSLRWGVRLLSSGGGDATLASPSATSASIAGAGVAGASVAGAAVGIGAASASMVAKPTISTPPIAQEPEWLAVSAPAAESVPEDTEWVWEHDPVLDAEWEAVAPSLKGTKDSEVDEGSATPTSEVDDPDNREESLPAPEQTVETSTQGEEAIQDLPTSDEEVSLAKEAEIPSSQEGQVPSTRKDDPSKQDGAPSSSQEENSSTRENHPSTQENHPSTQENHPSTQENHPSTHEDDVPSSRNEDIPSAREEVSPAADEGAPDKQGDGFLGNEGVEGLLPDKLSSQEAQSQIEENPHVDQDPDAVIQRVDEDPVEPKATPQLSVEGLVEAEGTLQSETEEFTEPESSPYEAVTTASTEPDADAQRLSSEGDPHESKGEDVLQTKSSGQSGPTAEYKAASGSNSLPPEPLASEPFAPESLPSEPPAPEPLVPEPHASKSLASDPDLEEPASTHSEGESAPTSEPEAGMYAGHDDL